MIKFGEKMLEINGNIPTLLSEYAQITRRLREILEKAESEEFAQVMIKRAYDIGFMSDEEIDEEFELAKRKLEKSEVAKVLRQLLS